MNSAFTLKAVAAALVLVMPIWVETAAAGEGFTTLVGISAEALSYNEMKAIEAKATPDDFLALSDPAGLSSFLLGSGNLIVLGSDGLS
ncbi:MAG: hypothetical protein ACRERD_10870, partial [Candidatus Binatia bacterium]